MSGGIKYDQGKAPLAMLPRAALLEIAQVMAYGASKYQKDNWRKGMDWSRLLDASLRHTYAFIDGEDKDPETNISHIAHAACNLLFLLQYLNDHPELDDRYKK